MPDTVATPEGAYLYEFLWRGRPSGSAEAPAYHVILARDATDGFGGTTTSLSPAMTPDQAAAAGFAMPAILADLNLALVSEASALKVSNAELVTAKTALEAQVAALAADRDALLQASATTDFDAQAAPPP